MPVSKNASMTPRPYVLTRFRHLFVVEQQRGHRMIDLLERGRSRIGQLNVHVLEHGLDVLRRRPVDRTAQGAGAFVEPAGQPPQFGLVLLDPAQPTRGVERDTRQFQPRQGYDASELDVRGALQPRRGHRRPLADVQRPEHRHVPRGIGVLLRLDFPGPVGRLQALGQGAAEFQGDDFLQTVAHAQPGLQHLVGQHGVEDARGPGASRGDQEFQVELGVVEQPQLLLAVTVWAIRMMRVCALTGKERKQPLERDPAQVEQVGMIRRSELDQPERSGSPVQAGGFGIAGQNGRGVQNRQRPFELRGLAHDREPRGGERRQRSGRGIAARRFGEQHSLCAQSSRRPAVRYEFHGDQAPTVNTHNGNTVNWNGNYRLTGTRPNLPDICGGIVV